MITTGKFDLQKEEGRTLKAAGKTERTLYDPHK